MIIEVPDWCVIGKQIEVLMYDENMGEFDWFKEKIIAYGVDGFFHQAAYCPVYYDKFDSYGNSVREVTNR